jgi:hypothetical protein
MWCVPMDPFSNFHFIQLTMLLRNEATWLAIITHYLCFVYFTASRPVLGLTQPPTRWVAGGSFSGGKAAGA